MLYVVGYKDEIPDGNIIVNTTSRSNNWSRGLSPFILSGGKLYGNYTAINVENAWQFSKVYPEHLDSNGDIKPEYFKWAEEGWNSEKAFRYPMGKNTKPLFTYWDGNRYDYITARKKVYSPIYARAVKNSPAFAYLKDLYHRASNEGVDIYLLDFDGYNHIKEGLTFSDVINNPNRKMGHAFIIWYLLEGLN
jgi:hypothetical protein